MMKLDKLRKIVKSVVSMRIDPTNRPNAIMIAPIVANEILIRRFPLALDDPRLPMKVQYGE
jgi:hypothetical protein